MLPRRVLVIIVNYRSAKLTLDALDSLAADRNDPALRLEVVVVENDSGDGPELERLLAGREGVTLIRAARNGGFAYGNNIGFAFGFGLPEVPDYFHLLNPDTRVSPGAIGALVRFMDDHPDVGLAGSSFQNADGSEWPIGFRFQSLASEIDGGMRTRPVAWLLKRWIVARTMGKTPEPVDWLLGASMMIRRAVLDAIGGFDEEYFLYFEETDFCFKARSAGWPCWYVPESRVMHIGGQSTGVTDRSVGPRRLPDYWFDSRRRFFTKNYGLPYAVATDAVAVAAFGLGRLKRMLTGRTNEDAPHYLKDLVRHSALWPRRWRIPAERTFTQVRP
jgi:N-acetylglucosaminyl-diphospho-decaprenol L-rhamnosyltransferase